MMGRQDDDHDQLFYQFNLDELVPEDHLLRYIDRVLDLKRLREHLAPFYSHTGRGIVQIKVLFEKAGK